jgi:glutamine amidotransferase
MKVVVVDCGMGNLRSVQKALHHVEPALQVVITRDPASVDSADRVVFPGQGAMPDCMRALHADGLADAVRRAAVAKPFLGLCIGMQMLFEHSEEGDTAGLGLLPGRITRFAFPAVQRLKVPHMGWNRVYQLRAHPLLTGIPDGERFYHVHSYYPVVSDAALAVTRTDYGGAFTSAVARANIFATQYHPEKSGDAGLRLFKNFLLWSP